MSVVSATYKYSKSTTLTFGLDQEITRPRGVLDSDTDLWPFAVDGRKNPIFRTQSPSSDNPGGIRYLVSSETFDIITHQLSHRAARGSAYTPWESQYVDVRAMEAPHGKDKVAQAEKSQHTHGRMPTREEIMAVPNGYFPVLGSSQVESIPAAGWKSGQTVAQVPQDAKMIPEATNPMQALSDALDERQSEGKYPPLV